VLADPGQMRRRKGRRSGGKSPWPGHRVLCRDLDGSCAVVGADGTGRGRRAAARAVARIAKTEWGRNGWGMLGQFGFGGMAWAGQGRADDKPPRRWVIPLPAHGFGLDRHVDGRSSSSFPNG
jgi:hypothetical protein